jgi:PAS domain S-box-containing protein
VDSSEDAIYAGDLAGKITAWNKGAERLYGYTAREIIGRPIDTLCPADRQAEQRGFTESVARTGKPLHVETVRLRKDGSTVRVALTLSPLQDAAGRIAGGSAIARDISERDRAEEALRFEQFLLRTLMDSLPDPIYFKDRQSRFIRGNQALARKMGADHPDQLVGKTDHDFFAPNHADAALKDEQDIVRTGQPIVNLEEREVWPDGREAWASTTKMPLRDASGSIVGTFGISRDITERREAERRLLESEARFRTAFMTGTDAYLIAGLTDGRIYEANDQFLAMYGFRRDEVIGRSSLELGLWPDPDQRRTLIARLTAEGQVRNFEVLARRKSGEPFPVVASVAVLPGDGRPLILSVIRDVSELRRSQQALQRMEEQFRQSQRLEAVGRLAGGVAHDFNNILTAISGHSSLLAESLAPDDPRREDVEGIRTAAQRAAALTRQLLAFSRKQVLQMRVLDVNEVVRALDTMLRRVIGEDIRLDLVLASDLAPVRADPGQLEQVIMNLAVNARDAMPGGGRLTIETANVALEEPDAAAPSALPSGPHVMVSVADTGVGMDAETQSHIFEPFFTTKEVGKGTGLGLSTVYGIVKQSGGSIWASSEPGRGATFRIYLPPVHEPVESPDVAAAPVSRPSGGHETLLLAEDDPGVRQIVSDALAQQGYSVLRAPDGQTALEIARAHPGVIHLLLTDLVMPGMTGRGLAEALRAERPGVRVLFMSGYTDDAVVRQAVLDTGLPFLQKPFTPGALAAKVRAVLDRR